MRSARQILIELLVFYNKEEAIFCGIHKSFIDIETQFYFIGFFISNFFTVHCMFLEFY